MQIHHGGDSFDGDTLPAAARGVVAALGNFDGVHRGHQSLLEAAAAASEAPRGVVTFEPHPRRFFQPDAPAFRLTPLAEKARVLARLGVNHLFALPFDAALAALSPEGFVAEILAGRLHLSHIVVGEDFRFGKARAGDAVGLRQLCEVHGIGVTIVHLAGQGGTEFSSTAVRVMIEQGRCEEAAQQLGRWHTVSGAVRQGDQRGRDLGYPTANLDLGEQLSPRFGVYAAEVEVHEGPHHGRHAGVAAVGIRPQFGVNAPNFEVHLFDFAGDLYGAEISVGLVNFLRPEATFDSVEGLIAQMDRDSLAAREALAKARLPV